MAIQFPLTAAQFFEGLDIDSMRCWFEEPKSVTQLADGTLIPASIGATLWRGEVTLKIKDHYAQAAVNAMLGLNSLVGASFLAYDDRYYGPSYDRTGALLGSSNVTILNYSSNNREFALAGLPGYYQIKRGDMIGWEYNGKWALHQVVTGKTANASGETSQIEVRPHIRAGLSNGKVVSLIQPVFRAILTAPVGYGTGRSRMTPGSTFSFTQTLDPI